MRNLESLNVGAHTYIVGYDSQAGKTGLIGVSQISGNLPWFGRKWPKGNSSPVGSPVGDFDLGQVLAKQLGLGGYLVQNDHSRTKLSATNHNLLENGGAADLTGAAGHYQWGWNVPMFYQKYEDDNFVYETISLGGPRKGFWNNYIPIGSRSCAGYATMDRTNTKLVSYVNDTAQYRGGNNDSTLDAAYNSQLCKPATNMAISAFRTAARKNGTLWFANERVMQFVTAMLKRIIFGNRNIQAAFNATLDANGLRQGGTGQGIDIPTNWDGNFHYYPYIRLDVGISDGDKTGLISTTITENGSQKTIENIPSFYGLKNDYKYLVCMSENMLLQCNADKSQSLFVADMVDGSNMNLESVSGLRRIAKGPVAASAGWQYAKDYVLKNLAFFPSDELGGSSSTYYCDGYYNPAATSGLRGAGLLGAAGDADDAGSLCLTGNVAPSAAYAGWGAFLCEWAEEFTTQPFWCKED
ncbi:MAG: hypothetical protein K6F02_01040 [Prevotella sp.]|nr:hypothetical protein [Prevotella sp.]